ncbi:hypothetical protein HPP92_028038 [Vanilla planifolia]|uniref:Uncharacterized protein n=1 Tax=Vanilla planifolia TaxID=51239 RepID=A0A835P9I9_VANPL|nr:hypothetical protein HPP92_028038 [Vanilla planifolia]
MHQVEGEDGEGEGVGAVAAGGEEDEGEPKSGTLHDEPGDGGRYGGAPTRTGVLAIGGGDEEEDEDIEQRREVDGDQGGGEQFIVPRCFRRHLFELAFFRSPPGMGSYLIILNFL